MEEGDGSKIRFLELSLFFSSEFVEAYRKK